MLGVLLVLGSAVLGGRIVATADSTVSVWAADGRLAPGTVLDADSLVAVGVRLDDGVDKYLSGPVPEGYVLVRAIGDGELVPASAVVPAAAAMGSVRHVAVAVAPQAVPGRLAVGDVVDVWVVPDSLADRGQEARLVVAGVAVAAVPAVDGGFAAASGAQTVVLALDGESLGATGLAEATADLVSASAAGLVAVTLDPAPQ